MSDGKKLDGIVRATNVNVFFTPALSMTMVCRLKLPDAQRFADDLASLNLHAKFA
jgi:hypothetical protein